MRSQVSEYLDEIVAATATGPARGEPATYIPELAHVDPTLLGVALTTTDGVTYAAGDADTMLSIQSISKPFVYALAMRDRGIAAVEEKVGVEPSGEAFNEMTLEEVSKRPYNPMINAGALATHALVGEPGITDEERDELVLAGLSAFAGRRLEVDEKVHGSEMDTAHRNFSIAHMLYGYDILTIDAHAAVRGYTRQCAIRASPRDLSVMAATLANGGTNPVTGEQVVPVDVVRQTLSVMLACGMYDAAGDWITDVGIPAKSGVGGGLIGALPGQLGVASFSPPLDEHGSSARGVEIFERLSHDFGLHLMSVPPLTRSVIRDRGSVDLIDGRSATSYVLQGPLRFSSVEAVVRVVTDNPPEHRSVVVDTTSATSVDATAARMLGDLVARLRAEGYEAWLVGLPGIIDPDDVAADVSVVPSVGEIDLRS
ncbi:glutaminase A [Georgenia sp. Z1344]|uniref:glutaminase A n=1 Tax=Georgenia sp. Z1344 TaxID=3416706 RepID=UPI003CF30594